MKPEEKQEQIKEQLEQLGTEKSRVSFLERFWYVFLILAMVAILVIVGLWISSRRLLVPEPTPFPTPSPRVEIDAATVALEQQETSDEISEIEADLEATDLTNIDKELTDIEAEFSSL